MQEGDICLAAISQADGQRKVRPVLLIKRLPRYSDFLVCGISNQLRQEVPGLDEIIATGDPDFEQSGLKCSSLIRLGFVATLETRRIAGVIGNIAALRQQRLLGVLADYLFTNRLWGIQSWYTSQCNGEWEHQFGIRIDTLDNPGWALLVDLTGTALQSVNFEPLSENRSGSDWLSCKVEDRVFKAAGDSSKLETMLGTFIEWRRKVSPVD
jgi:mRNA interferase MazF